MTVAIFNVGNDGVAVINANGANGLNTGFLNYGNEINRIGTIVDAASITGAASALVKADSSGIAHVNLLGSLMATTTLGNTILGVAPSTTTTGIIGRAFDNAAGHFAIAAQNAAGTTVASIDAIGVLTILNILNSTGALMIASGTGYSPLTVRAFSSTTQALITGQGIVAGVATITSQVNSDGSAVYGGLVTANAFSGNGAALTGVVAASAATAGTASALVAPVAFDSVVSDYKLTANAAAQTIGVTAGGPYADSAGALVPASGAGFAVRTINLSNAVSSAQPSGTNVQWVNISAAPATGALVATGGVVGTFGGTATVPATPAGNTPLGWAIWRGATTNPTNVVAAGDIFNARFPSGAGVGGGGGGGGAPTTGAYWTQGTNVALPDALDSSNPVTNGYMHPLLIKTGLNEGSLIDTLRGAVQPDTISRISSTGAVASLTFSASSPWSATANGRTRTANNNATQPALTATASGTANQQRTLVVDLNGASVSSTDHGMRLLLIGPGVALSAYQIALQNYWWDGTTITPLASAGYAPFIDSSPISSLISPAVSLSMVRIAPFNNGAGQTPGNVAAAIPGQAAANFTLPCRCSGWLNFTCWYTVAFTASQPIYIVPILDGVAVSFAYWMVPTSETRTAQVSAYIPRMDAGPHTLALGVYNGGVATGSTFIANYAYLDMALYKG